MKDKVNQVVTSTRRVVTNAERFFQASFLAVLAGFSWYALNRLNLGSLTEAVVRVSVAGVGLRAAYEYYRFLDK